MWPHCAALSNENYLHGEPFFTILFNYFFYSHGYPRGYPQQWSRYRMEENCPILMSKRNAIFSVSPSPPYTSFLPINTWQRGDEKSRIKTNEFRFRRANFIQRTSQVLPSIPRTTLNHYVYYYGLCHLFYNVNREWMPACLLRPIKISICRAGYQRTRYTGTSVTYRCLEAYSTRALPLVANQSWLLNCVITDLQIGSEDCTV